MQTSSPIWTLNTRTLPGGHPFYQVAVTKAPSGTVNGWIWALGPVVAGSAGRAVYVDRRDGLGFVQVSGILTNITAGTDRIFGVNHLGTLYTSPYNCGSNAGCWSVESASGITGTPQTNGHRSAVAGNQDYEVFILNTSDKIFKATE